MNACIGKRVFHLSIPLLALLLGAASATMADDARVLPRGVSQSYLDYYRYYPTTHRYNADGDREALASPFSQAALDNTVFDTLPPGASLGDVAVEYEYDIDVLDLGYAFGLTENLSIGLHIPYYWIENDVDIDFDNSNATVGIDNNGNVNSLLVPGVRRATEDDVQDLIHSTYGFEEVDSWEREGIGDIEIGAKYRFYLERDSALAFTGGLRIPTGYEDDADRLDDVAWSFGNYALLFRLHCDYLLSNLWKQSPTRLHQPVTAAGDTLLNLTFRYDYMLPDDKIMRVGDTPEQVFTNNRERVDRKLGDIFNLELSLRYWTTEALSFAAAYTYGFKLEDDISGDRDYHYESLEQDTDSEEQIVVVSANYSTLPAYRAQQSKAPMDFSLAYRERFAANGPQSGQANPKLYTRWIQAGLDILF